MKKTLIRCDIHDHFELACMHRSQLTLNMHDGTQHNGIAVDLETKNKVEYLHLKTNANVIDKVNLLDIKSIRVDNSKDSIEIN